MMLLHVTVCIYRTHRRSFLLQKGGRQYPLMDRPVITRVLSTYFSSNIPPLICVRVKIRYKTITITHKNTQYLGKVKVGGVSHGSGVVAGVTSRDDFIEEVFEDCVRLFIACHTPHRVDVGVTRVVHSSLDALVDCVAVRCLQSEILDVVLQR